MSYRSHVLIAAGGSAALLLGALAFQYLGGLAPCKLCYWQRYPHALAVAIGVLALWLGGRTLARLGALAALATAGVGLYHTGVERGWWEGPTSCSGAGPGLGGMKGSDLLSTDGPVNVVMCDEVAWQMLGLSMASWNMVASLVLVGFWIAAARRG
ncbi:disulfide bond formation protein B [Pseudooceanicola nanhaiensis]|uniref:disulfide bond formation protein B n=1 Tax=Pseudooceanicola nanhaiensis TaxID=375761 RepID=UPI0040592A2C